jgi:hypothetical protein
VSTKLRVPSHIFRLFPILGMNTTSGDKIRTGIEGEETGFDDRSQLAQVRPKCSQLWPFWALLILDPGS